MRVLCIVNFVLVADSLGLLHIDGDERPTSERVRAVFGENYPRLQAIKKKYDPEMVFSKWFGITPA